jgi:hypothetical protein
MTASKLSLLLAASALALGLAGCNNFSTRAREKSEVFQSLPPETRQRLQHGRISIGDSQDMVYIALGYPDEVRELRTPQGVQTVWIYRTYWQQYEGTEWVGWHRVIVPLRSGGYAVMHEPISTDVYRTHVDEVIRVTFDHGVVAAVEQQNRR